MENITVAWPRLWPNGHLYPMRQSYLKIPLASLASDCVLLLRLGTILSSGPRKRSMKESGRSSSSSRLLWAHSLSLTTRFTSLIHRKETFMLEMKKKLSEPELEFVSLAWQDLLPCYRQFFQKKSWWFTYNGDVALWLGTVLNDTIRQGNDSVNTIPAVQTSVQLAQFVTQQGTIAKLMKESGWNGDAVVSTVAWQQ